MSFGGLLSTWSTPGGTSPSATSRRPQPVSMSTSVAGTLALIVDGHLAAVHVRHAEIGDDHGKRLAVGVRLDECLDARLAAVGGW